MYGVGTASELAVFAPESGCLSLNIYADFRPGKTERVK